MKRKSVSIGTHSGTFHCDEALGCWLLSKTQAFKDATIVRTRDPDALSRLDVVIDVGGVYDPASHRYDHHQRGFSEVFGHGFTTKLSSAGLVYKHFGEEVVASIMGVEKDSPDVRAVWLKVYATFIEAVDGVDNGVNQYESDKPPRYVNNTTLSARVGSLNPEWNEVSDAKTLDERFQAAVALTGSEFEAAVQHTARSWLPGKSLVAAAIAGRHQVDPSGSIIRLDTFCPWKAHLYDLEGELGVEPPGVLFCLYEDERERKWRIQAVSVAAGSFDNRLSLPAAWRGLRDAELAAVSGVPGAVFCHAGGFIGGADTYEGVLAMARLALAEGKE